MLKSSLVYLYFHLLQRLRDLLQLAFNLDRDQSVHVWVLHLQALHGALEQSLLGTQLAVNFLKPEREELCKWTKKPKTNEKGRMMKSMLEKGNRKSDKALCSAVIIKHLSINWFTSWHFIAKCHKSALWELFLNTENMPPSKNTCKQIVNSQWHLAFLQASTSATFLSGMV